jgi:hypothetical protein
LKYCPQYIPGLSIQGFLAGLLQAAASMMPFSTQLGNIVINLRCVITHIWLCQGNPRFGRFGRFSIDLDASAALGALDAFPSGLAPDTSDDFPPGAPDTSAPFYLTAKPPETSVRSRWHVLCDQAHDHCR